MRIAALSDFHIGSHLRNDAFLHEEHSFMRFLDRLEAEHERVVLLGDVFQAEHGWAPGRSVARRELDAAVQRVPQLWSKMSRYEYIHGNHDAVAREHFGARTSLHVEADGFGIYFIHGHQFDPMLRNFYPAARLGTWLMGRVRRAGLRGLAEYFEHKDITVKDGRFGGEGGPYAAAGRALLRQMGVDVVVMGHTHVPRRVEVAEGILANTGSCSLGQRMYVSIDTHARSVEVVKSAPT